VKGLGYVQTSYKLVIRTIQLTLLSYEGAVKTLNRDNLSIVHIYTHGYFLQFILRSLLYDFFEKSVFKPL
jgi:ADP-dependent phosphofructokinase/glucokinase